MTETAGCRHAQQERVLDSAREEDGRVVDPVMRQHGRTTRRNTLGGITITPSVPSTCHFKESGTLHKNLDDATRPCDMTKRSGHRAAGMAQPTEVRTKVLKSSSKSTDLCEQTRETVSYSVLPMRQNVANVF